MDVVYSNKKALIQYLFHSGFTVETGDYFLIFDFFDPSDNTVESGAAGRDIREKIANSKYPFVFASHSHHDHFSSSIFKWKRENPRLTYILSSDIKLEYNALDSLSDFHYISMAPYEHASKNAVTISTFGSTDIGVSFLVDVDGLRIFHAGDLNWWHWADESTGQELEEEEWKFKNEVAKMSGERIDILFFPVDPRLGEHYWMGGAYMLKIFQPGLFVPMHFGNNSGITKKFSKKMSQSAVPVLEITTGGQTYEYNKQ